MGFWPHCRQDAGFEDDEEAVSISRSRACGDAHATPTLLLIALLPSLLAKCLNGTKFYATPSHNACGTATDSRLTSCHQKTTRNFYFLFFLRKENNPEMEQSNSSGHFHVLQWASWATRK